MQDPTGEPLASGRAADVYALGDGTVLRRYRTDHDVTREARLMRWLAERSVPVPTVLAASGRDLVMERVVGPTMLEDLERRPWRIVAHARTLARLQRTLAGLVAPDWLPEDQWLGPGRSVLHLDLHPMNVLLGATGPVLIDWTNARRGPAGADAAVTHVLMAGAEVSGLRDRCGRRLLVLAFDAARGARLVRRHLGAAATHRLDDPNLTAVERRYLERLAARHAPRPG